MEEGTIQPAQTVVEKTYKCNDIDSIEGNIILFGWNIIFSVQLLVVNANGDVEQDGVEMI